MLHSCNMYLADQIHLPFDTDVFTHKTSPSLPRQMPSQLFACIFLSIQGLQPIIFRQTTLLSTNKPTTLLTTTSLP